MQLNKLAELLHARLVGKGDAEILGVSSIESASAGNLIFVEEEKKLQQALESGASAVLVGGFGGAKSSKPFLICTQPRLAFARAARYLAPALDRNYGIHSSALVHPSARLAKEVKVEERVVIGESVEIGSGSRIGAGNVIGAQVRIGNDCELHPNVTIYPGTRMGNRVVIHAGAVLGSDGFGYV